MIEAGRLERFVNKASPAIAIPLVAVAYFLLAWTAYGLFGAESIGATFFPPAGLTVALLYVADFRRWPIVLVAIVIGEVGVDLVHGAAPGPIVGYVAANTVEPVTGALLLRALSPTLFRPGRIDALMFVMCAVVAGPIVGGAIGATTELLSAAAVSVSTPGASLALWIDVFVAWTVGDALGVLAVGPLILIHLSDDVPEQRPGGGWVSIGLMAAGLVTLSTLLFVTDRLPFGYLSIPMLAWSALRFGGRGVAYSAAWLASVSTAATAFDRGPWAGLPLVSVSEQLLNQQSFWLAAIAGGWFLAIEIRRREAAIAARAMTSERSAFESRRRGEAEALADVLLDLAKARTRREVATAIYLHAAERYGVMGVTISTASSAGELPEDVVWVDSDGAIELTGDAVTAVGPLAEATRTGSAVLAEDVATIARRFAGVAVGVESHKVKALACYPVRSGDQVAAVLFAWNVSQRLGPVESIDLAGLASVAGASYDRARLYDIESTIANSFQRALLAEPEYDLPGIEVSTRYIAATNLMEVGGDWYDVVPIDDSTVALVIGDVVGKGLAAAAATGRLRGAARALALSFGPSEVLRLLDRLASEDDRSSCATAAIVTIDTVTRELSYSLAGHPGPLLRVPGGGVRVLDEAVGPPLGAFGSTVRPEGSLVLEPGSIVVMFTDGLVERRGEVFDVGVNRVVERLRVEPAAGARSLIEALVDAGLSGVEQRDDVAVICAHLDRQARTGVDASGSPDALVAIDV